MFGFRRHNNLHRICRFERSTAGTSRNNDSGNTIQTSGTRIGKISCMASLPFVYENWKPYFDRVNDRSSLSFIVHAQVEKKQNDILLHWTHFSMYQYILHDLSALLRSWACTKRWKIMIQVFAPYRTVFQIISTVLLKISNTKGNYAHSRLKSLLHWLVR